VFYRLFLFSARDVGSRIHQRSEQQIRRLMRLEREALCLNCLYMQMFCSNSYFLQQITFNKNMTVAGDKQGFFSAKSLFPVHTVFSDAA